MCNANRNQQCGEKLETMPDRRTFVVARVGWLGLSLALSLAAVAHAQTYPPADPPVQSSSPPPQLPAECTAPRGATDPIEASLEALGPNPSSEALARLGSAFGRAADFKCAEAAFEAALVLDPNAWQTRYNLALALIENHQSSRAVDELHTLIAQRSDSAVAHNALGLALQDLGQPDAAAGEFKTALGIDPHFDLASYNLGQLLSSQKEYSAAIHYLKLALADSPAPAPELAFNIKIALAAAYSQTGDYTDSIPILQAAVAARPDSRDLHYDLATDYADNQSYAKAADEFKEALRLDPHESAAELSLAKALLNMSAVEDAIPYLEDYTRQNPDDPEGVEILGDALKDSAHQDEALQVLARAVQLNPSSYKAHYDFAVVLDRSGRDDDAIRELQTAIGLKPDGTEARYLLGRILSKRNDAAAANQQFQVFEQLKQNDAHGAQAGLLNSQANQLLQQGKAQEAVDAYRKALLLDPNDASIHFNLALALEKLNDSAGEERELKKAIELNPKFDQAHTELGSTFMLQGRMAEAETEFKAVIDDDPQSAQALNNLGTLYGREARNQEAVALLEKAVSLDPQFLQAYVNLGLTLAAEGDFANAEDQFQAALRLDPNNANALTALGMLQGKTGRDPDSVLTFRKLTAIYPASAMAHVNLGIALVNVYDLQGALAEFKQAARLDPSLPIAHFSTGRALYALNQMDDAEQELRMAIRLAPTYVDAMFLLGVIEHSSPDAAEQFRKVVELQPNNSEARFYPGRNLLEEGKRDQAIAQWEKAVEVDPDNLAALSSLSRTLNQIKSPDAPKYTAQLDALQQRLELTDRVQRLSNFALQAADDNDWSQAIGQMQQAIDLCKDCAQLGILRKNLGIIYARRGDVGDAKQQLELALKLLPEGPDSVATSETLKRLTPDAQTPTPSP